MQILDFQKVAKGPSHTKLLCINFDYTGVGRVCTCGLYSPRGHCGEDGSQCRLVHNLPSKFHPKYNVPEM